jgi:uncharacterized protein (DUF433 family)
MTKIWPDDLPIWSDPERLGGAPCFADTRVPVEALFANLEDGVSLDEFLAAFEGVKGEHALAVLEYARQLFAERAGETPTLRV